MLCAKKWVKNTIHHISITFLWQCDEGKRSLNLTEISVSRLISTHCKFHQKVTKLWWKCDDWILTFLVSWLFHHICITMVWKEVSMPSQSHENVTGMWYQEKNIMPIEISILPIILFCSSVSGPQIRAQIFSGIFELH